jgi:hypothetical protein
MTALIDVVPEVSRRGSLTVVGFTTSARDRSPLTVEFEIEGLAEPSDLAATEAMMIASVALAMQQQCGLRIHGSVSRSLRHTIDLYQEACAWWWPQRYRRVHIDVSIVDDQPPATTRGVVCFSGGVDSIYSAEKLRDAAQITSALLVEGYDIDLCYPASQRDQRDRVERLLGRLGIPLIVIRTNARAVLGQEVIEGAQGSYLAAALTLLSDSFGRGFVSSGIMDLSNIGEGDPVHEAAIPLLGSARYPIHVYGGQISRFEKLRDLAAKPDLFRDVRVCLDRTGDGHCGRCSKCLFNAFACVAMTGTWPSWLPQHKINLAGVATIGSTEHRTRFAREILQIAKTNNLRGEWMSVLETWLDAQAFLSKRPPWWRRRASKARRAVQRLLSN